MAQLKEGMPAPPFEGTDQNGKMVRMSELKEQIFGLYQ